MNCCLLDYFNFGNSVAVITYKNRLSIDKKDESIMTKEYRLNAWNNFDIFQTSASVYALFSIYLNAMPGLVRAPLHLNITNLKKSNFRLF